MKEMLELRKKLKKKMPDFNREDWHKKKRVEKGSWRKPKGRHSKMRHNFQGHPATANPGYRVPKLVRGLHKSGLVPVRVSTIKELLSLDKVKHAVIISSRVGTRKKVDLVRKIKELGLKLVNLKDPEAYIKKVEEDISQKKAVKAESKKKKTEKVKEKEKKSEEQKKEAPESKEDVKKKETKELEKVLTKRSQ